MQHTRAGERGFGQQQRHHVSSQLRALAAAGLAVVLVLAGCHAGHGDPAVAYERIHADLLAGKLDRAQTQAQAERRAIAGRDAAWSFRFCLLEAEIQSVQGRSQDVVNVLEEGDRVFSPQGDLAIKQATLLSLAYARLGRAADSAQQLQLAEGLSAATQSPLQGEVLRTEGLLENRSDDQVGAEHSFGLSLEFARKHKDAFLEASDLLNLGRVALQVEHIDEALDRFNASSQIAGVLHASTLLQSALGNAGWAYYKLGDFEQALASFEQAGAQARTLGATDNEILWLQSAGLSLYELGELDRARTCYEEALRAARASQDTARTAATETSLGELLLQRGELDEAQAHADEALRAAQRISDKASELDAQILQGFIAARRATDEATEQRLLGLYAQVQAAPSLRWEMENALADLYSRRGENRVSDRWHRLAIATFEAQRASVEDEERRLPFFANGDMLYREYAEFLIARGQQDEALQLLDGARARTLKEGLGESAAKATASWADPAQVARRLQAVVLFYSLGPQRSYLWALDGKETHLFTIPAQADIAQRVKSYQASILKSRDPLREGNADGQWLYNALVAPAEALIPQGARVVMIPGGAMNGFNPETLLKAGPQGLHYWIEDVSLMTASSIHLLANSQAFQTQRHGGKLLLMGDAVAVRSEYAALPNAPAEIENVQRYFAVQNRTTLTQAAAVPGAYAASRPESYDYIHFVAHGIASRQHPLDSAVVLSSSTADHDHFKLYARDIVRQRLHARLVTVSACYGSGLRNYADEGLVGLSWAFLRAGAHQVIGATWEVNDSSTPQLMDKLYGGLAKGDAPDRALRAAKLSLLHSEGIYRKPLYWAAFQLYAGS